MINYPTSIDALSNPASSDLMENATAALDHNTQHANANDAIEALEAKVGADSSAVTTSHDYKLGEVTGTDKAVGKTATQTLTNKTLTSPAINMGSDATGDTYYRTAGGAFARLPIGTSGQILQTSASAIPEWIANPSAADASTTVKGVSEEATQAEFDAGTTAGGTSARLFVNPSTVRAKLINTGVLDTGSANAVAIAPSPAITAYAAYQEFTFKAAATNTGATTINVNALGTKNIYKNGTSALTGGEIVTGGIYTVVYDGTQFQLYNNSASGSSLLYRATSTVTVTSSGEQTALSQTITGGTLGSTRGVRVKMGVKCVSSGTDTCVFKFKYGATTLITSATFTLGNGTTAQGFIEFTLLASGATNTQYGNSILSLDRSDTAAQIAIESNQSQTGTAAEDSTADKTLAITVNQSAGNQTWTFMGITIEKLS